MKSLHLNALSYLVVLILLNAACKKYAPAGVSIPKPFKASFTIYEPFYGTSNIYPTDTIITYRAMFTADDNYESYVWTVGDDPTIRTTKSFVLDFPLSVSGRTLAAKLIASRNGKSDTTVKSFTIYAVKGTPNERSTPYSLKLPYTGTFEGGFEDAPTHKFVVTITNLDTSTAYGSFKGFRVLNLPEGCGGRFVQGQSCFVNNISPEYYSYSFQYTYKAFYVDEGDEIGCCPKVNLYGSLDNNNPNKIIVECIFLNNDPNKAPVKRKFIGFRL